MDTASRTFLQSHAVITNTQHDRNCIDDYINGRSVEAGCASPGAAPINNIELKTLREKFTIGYRNTMWDNWDFNTDYSHEHRTGTRPLGISIGLGTTANPARSGTVEVPQPLDDKTQNLNAAGEYVGTTPWGTRWNTAVKYAGSYFSNNNKSIDVDNPFCITCSPAGPAFGANRLRYSLYPDNSANGLTWNTAVDLPIFKSRYVSTLQYTAFRQNDAFIDSVTNGITGTTPYPRASLNGEINAFLSNNVLTSHITKDVSNTARVRYYDRKDNTPTFTNGTTAYLDSRTLAGPFTRNPTSSSKLNFEDEVKWQANRTWAFGVGSFFERMIYQNGEVDSTNEPGAKAFVNGTWRLASMRSSLEYSQRRYNTYLATGADAAANAQRFFFVANRNRTKANTIVELAAFKNVTISPNGGLRWDEYPADQVANSLLSLGTKYDRSWNLGSDLGVRATPDLRMNFGYNHEEHYLRMQSCCGSGTLVYADQYSWASDIRQFYNTYTASADWKAIPGKLDFTATYLVALSTEANQTQTCSSNNNSCNGTGGSPV